jgi:flagellar hook-basal body complex protein FliE
MADPIRTGAVNPLRPTSPVDAGPRPGRTAEKGGADFHTILQDSLDEVNRLQQEAEAAAQKLATGEAANPEEVFSAIRKAGVAFDLLMEIRNKLVDAYKEIEQMRV